MGLSRPPTRGLAGLAQAMRDILSPWDRYRGRVEEYRELEAERVLVLIHPSGRGKASGLELDGGRHSKRRWFTCARAR